VRGWAEAREAQDEEMKVGISILGKDQMRSEWNKFIHRNNNKHCPRLMWRRRSAKAISSIYHIVRDRALGL
jgi:hypothetical protein